MEEMMNLAPQDLSHTRKIYCDKCKRRTYHIEQGYPKDDFMQNYVCAEEGK